MKTTTKLTLALFLTSLITSSAQRIDFESLPDTSIPTDGLIISNQFWQAFGVSFRFEDGTFPQIAEVGPPRTAFLGPPTNSSPDTAAPGENVGRFFLTGGEVAGGPPLTPLVIDYAQPVAAASGVIIDIGANDRWRIVARDSQTQVVATVILEPTNPNAGDGMATPWSFSRPSADIHSIRIIYTGTSGPGFAFDNFSPVTALPAPEPARLDLMYSATNASLTITGTLSALYKLQFTATLPTTNWTPLTNIYLPSSPFTVFDWTATNSPVRFYRAAGIQ